MNVIFTSCSFKDGAEWSPFLYRMSLLAIGSAKKRIKDAHTVLYCDKSSYKYLKTIKSLDEAHVIDYDSYDFDKRFWCFPKFISYSLQDKPFVHIDLDICITKDITIPSTDIVSERLRMFDGEGEELRHIDNKLPVPESIYCSGIFGGTNTKFFKEFFEHASEVCSKKNLMNEEVKYEHLYSLEEAWTTQKFLQRNMRVSTLEDESYIHFWQKPKEQFDTEIRKIIRKNNYI